jgi:hypothetical protein
MKEGPTDLGLGFTLELRFEEGEEGNGESRSTVVKGIGLIGGVILRRVKDVNPGIFL